MNEKFRNVVCSPKDIFADAKREIFELINLNKTVCNNLPDLSIPNLIPQVPNLNPSQKVIDLLSDVLALVSGINFDEMRMQLINWLVRYYNGTISIIRDGILVGNITLGVQYSSPDNVLTFTIQPGGYTDGDKWEFTTFPYNQDLVIDDFSVPVLYNDNIILNITEQTNTQ